jgi:hypothetical protein
MLACPLRIPGKDNNKVNDDRDSINNKCKVYNKSKEHRNE